MRLASKPAGRIPHIFLRCDELQAALFVAFLLQSSCMLHTCLGSCISNPSKSLTSIKASNFTCIHVLTKAFLLQS